MAHPSGSAQCPKAEGHPSHPSDTRGLNRAGWGGAKLLEQVWDGAEAGRKHQQTQKVRLGVPCPLYSNSTETGILSLPEHD